MHNLKLTEVPQENIQGSSIGDILHKAGRLTVTDLDRVMALQDKEQMLFGTAAVSLGVVTEEDIRWALGCQYSYPSIQAADAKVAQELMVVREPFGAPAEEFRSIRSGLLLSGVGNMMKTLAVLSPGEGEGRTFIAANLAVVFAQLGSRTLLVDLNFRKPRIHEVFRLKNNTGASSLMIKRALVHQAISQTDLGALEVLTSGPKPPNPLELLSWQETRTLIQGLKEQYDVVIIDTPAFSKTADAMHIASLCDGSLIVAQKGKTKFELFGQLKKQLDNSGARIVGSVMNEIKPSGKR